VLKNVKVPPEEEEDAGAGPGEETLCSVGVEESFPSVVDSSFSFSEGDGEAVTAFATGSAILIVCEKHKYRGIPKS
tara:strand:- start:604 stop:831 length:228 start_codon:yes stop_codon:yes gene_type:complete